MQEKQKGDWRVRTRNKLMQRGRERHLGQRATCKAGTLSFPWPTPADPGHDAARSDAWETPRTGKLPGPRLRLTSNRSPLNFLPAIPAPRGDHKCRPIAT